MGSQFCRIGSDLLAIALLRWSLYEVSMSILPGTRVQLPNGRSGVVIPGPLFSPGRVLVKVQHGRKRWFRVDECIPIPVPC